VKGVVQTGGDGQPLGRATVSLHRVSGGTCEEVARVAAQNGGEFSFEVVASAGDHFYYAVAVLGEGIVLMTILGASIPPRFVINELTTVAAAYTAAQCLDGTTIQGSALALRIIAAMNANLIDPLTGTVSGVMAKSPNADETNSCRTLMSLANLLTTAVRGGSGSPALKTLLTLTTPPDGPAPANTVEALGNLARNPASHTGGIYVQSRLAHAYEPALREQPDAWTLVVKVNDSGDDRRMFAGPGSIAFDAQGRAWIPNNVVQGTGNSSRFSMVLDLSGRPARDANGRLLSPFEGGGLLGAGFGAAIDKDQNVWIGDFGWGDLMPVGGVSTFHPDARPISPAPNGYTEGGMYRVQGVTVDDAGNVWMCGWGNGTVVCYRGGRPHDHAVYQDDSGTFKPFGVAIAKDGTAWVANSDGSNSGILNLALTDGPDLQLLHSTSIGKVLKGVQIDSAGNVWVGSGSDHHVYIFDKEGTLIGGYQGGGINGPWGIALDGADNLWVGNFGPLEVGTNFHGRLTQLAGVNAKGYLLGDALTPPTGYTLPTAGSQVLLHDGTPLYGPDGPPCFIPMMRTTGVQVDAAGNVWTCNNWKPDFNSDLFGDPLRNQAPNPGGDGILIWLGLATPVRR
jgi:hypothetical protein